MASTVRAVLQTMAAKFAVLLGPHAHKNRVFAWLKDEKTYYNSTPSI